MNEETALVTARITEYEEMYNQSKQIVDSLEQDLEAFEQNRDTFRALFRYYFGDQWLKDYDFDQNGSLPEEINRGILGQDTLYNLYADLRGLRARLDEVSKVIAEMEFEDYRKTHEEE